MKVEKNEYGTPFLYYSEDKEGSFNCWMEIDPELFNELEALKKENAELKAEPILLKQTISLLENRIEELKKWIRNCNITSRSKDKALGEQRF